MTPVIIHLFEVIQVDKAEAQRVMVPQGSGDFLFQDLIQPAPVVQPGKRIANGLFLERAAQLRGN